ncbi:MAG: hypothetical protein SO173_00820 [Lachnospiraceae bacterium]|nr:hypothetical protein [Lachnospiraceae bacterium]
MRKVKKIIGISIVFVLILLGLSRVNRCGNNSPNHGTPYDNFSRAIYREMGDDIWYYYKDKGRSGEKEYYYIIEKCDRDTITRFAKVLNDLAQEEKKKIAIYVEVEDPYGSESVLNLKNYSNDNSEQADYERFYALSISYPDFEEEPRNPQTYTGIEGIKHLRIDSEMQKKAEEQGIDWYEVWPDLEDVVVY